MPENVRSTPEVSLWSESENRQQTPAAQQAGTDERVFGIQEKSEGDLLCELETLETKIEALVSRCEELQQLNESLTVQLVKERESKAALLDIQSDAKKRVDHLIEKLDKVREAG